RLGGRRVAPRHGPRGGRPGDQAVARDAALPGRHDDPRGVGPSPDGAPRRRELRAGEARVAEPGEGEREREEQGDGGERDDRDGERGPLGPRDPHARAPSRSTSSNVSSRTSEAASMSRAYRFTRAVKYVWKGCTTNATMSPYAVVTSATRMPPATAAGFVSPWREIVSSAPSMPITVPRKPSI